MTGPNRAKFLHNLLSNDILGLKAGASAPAALMNIKGQQVAWMRVMAEEDAMVCELPLSVRDTVVEAFIHYKVGTPVRFAKPDTVIFAMVGDGEIGRERLKDLGFEAFPSAPETFVSTSLEGATILISRGHDIPAMGFTLHVNSAEAAGFEERLRRCLGEPVPGPVFDTLRVEEGIPWHGIDVTEDNLLHETGQLLVYHSSSKGCYLGQEVVARLEGRGGNVNRRFRGMRCEAVVTKGAEITLEGKAVGRVTSAGFSPEFGPIAMGFVHRASAEAQTRVSVAGVEAAIVVLPFRN